MTFLASDSPRHSPTSLETASRIQRNPTGSNYSSTKFVFLGPIGKSSWPLWLLIGLDIFDFSGTAERNSMKLDIWVLAPYRVSQNYVELFQRRSRKCLRQLEARAAIFVVRLARKTQLGHGHWVLNSFLPSCVFRAYRKTKMATLSSDWPRCFWLLCNHWTEFNETWHEARSKRPLPNFWC